MPVEHMVTDSDLEGSHSVTIWHKEKFAAEKWLIVEAKQLGHASRARGYWSWLWGFKSSYRLGQQERGSKKNLIWRPSTPVEHMATDPSIKSSNSATIWHNKTVTVKKDLKWRPSTPVEHMATDPVMEDSNPDTIWHNQKIAVKKDL